MEIFNFMAANQVVIIGALLAISEVLGLIPSVKSNSIFEIIVGVLQKLVPTKAATPEA